MSRASKEGQPKDQILINVFLMLDREFEQSVMTGVEGLRKGRMHEVPKGYDAVEFLMELAKQA